MNNADKNTKIIANGARSKILEMLATTDISEVQELGDEIIRLVYLARDRHQIAIERRETFSRNFTELMPELLGEKAGN